MRLTLLQHKNLLAVLSLPCLMLAAGAVASAQDSQDAGPTSFTVTCEVSCSQESVGIGQARLSWTAASGKNLESFQLDAPGARLWLETTVYRGGFEEDQLHLSMPLSSEGDASATLEEIAAEPDRPRPFQIRLLKSQRAMALTDFDTPMTPDTSAVVEGLEPGMNYTWRVVLESGPDRLISETVTCRAPICPADPIRGEEQ